MTDAPGPNDPAGGRRAAVSNAIVGLFKEFYGKGPTSAKTYFNDDWVFCVMEGGLTRNEETFLAAGKADLVRQVRLEFQDIMRARVTEAVEAIVERRVLTYHSQVLFDPVRFVEMFLLEPLPPGQ
ncbi:MAG TPA: Na-translocating system protein MpsC family protein [Baekduia sp.]